VHIVSRKHQQHLNTCPLALGKAPDARSPLGCWPAGNYCKHPTEPIAPRNWPPGGASPERGVKKSWRQQTCHVRPPEKPPVPPLAAKSSDPVERTPTLVASCLGGQAGWSTDAVTPEEPRPVPALGLDWAGA